MEWNTWISQNDESDRITLTISIDLFFFCDLNSIERKYRNRLMLKCALILMENWWICCSFEWFWLKICFCIFEILNIEINKSNNWRNNFNFHNWLTVLLKLCEPSYNSFHKTTEKKKKNFDLFANFACYCEVELFPYLFIYHQI